MASKPVRGGTELRRAATNTGDDREAELLAHLRRRGDSPSVRRNQGLPPSRAGLLLLNVAAALIVVGGLYDIFTPTMPAHELEFIRRAGADPSSGAVVLSRELLRALGGALTAIGLATLVLVNVPFRRGERWAGWTIATVVVVAEGVNAVGMARVGGPFWAPIAFIGLVLAGLVIARLGPVDSEASA